jgi:hypothetical protein
MAKRDDKFPNSPTADGEFIWPRLNKDIRSLTEHEIEGLEHALGKPVDRVYLVAWVSRSISDVVKLSAQPSPRECRDGLERLARQGRKWLDQIDDCPGNALLEESNVSALKASVVQFCERAELVARRFGQLIKPGQSRTPPALNAFLDNMIGIAKCAKVPPSTPQRFMETSRPPPSFFVFVEQALAIAENVIQSSPIPDRQKQPALASLRCSSRDALIKIVEGSRGLIRNYRETPHRLIELKDKQTRTRRRRSMP